LDFGWWMVDSFRIQNCSFKIRVSGADEDVGVPKWDGGLVAEPLWRVGQILDVGCWMLDSFRIQNCSFKIRVSGADEDGGVPKWDGGWWTGEKLKGHIPHSAAKTRRPGRPARFWI
jgi:hypothetical protein